MVFKVGGSVVRDILEPMLTRVGTIVSVFLASNGLQQHEADAVAAALIVLIGVGVDLVVRKVIQRK